MIGGRDYFYPLQGKHYTWYISYISVFFAANRVITYYLPLFTIEAANSIDMLPRIVARLSSCNIRHMSNPGILSEFCCMMAGVLWNPQGKMINTPPKFNIAPKSYLAKRNVVFQPSFFRAELLNFQGVFVYDTMIYTFGSCRSTLVN